MHKPERGAKKAYLTSNVTVQNLVSSFINEYMEKGEAGMPVRMSDKDIEPVEPNIDHYNKVTNLYLKGPFTVSVKFSVSISVMLIAM